jgi:class 3 adenylate cyclase
MSQGQRSRASAISWRLGAMELLADRDPEEARNLLDPVLERMMEVVHRYEGTVNQVMGNGKPWTRLSGVSEPSRPSGACWRRGPPAPSLRVVPRLDATRAVPALWRAAARDRHGRGPGRGAPDPRRPAVGRDARGGPAGPQPVSRPSPN